MKALRVISWILLMTFGFGSVMTVATTLYFHWAHERWVDHVASAAFDQTQQGVLNHPEVIRHHHKIVTVPNN